MRRLTLLLATLTAFASGCAADRDKFPSAWAAGDMVRLTEQSSPQPDKTWDAPTSSVRLSAGANETVSFQLVIDAPAGGAEKLSLKLGELTAPGVGKLPPESATFFRMRSIEVDSHPAWFLRISDRPARPERIYDVLTPLPGEINLAPRERLAVWVDVYVPRDAGPGEYVAPLTLATTASVSTAQVRLKVYDFVLPDIHPVPCVGGFSHKTLFRRLARGGANPATAAGIAPLRMDPANKDVSATLVLVRQLMRLAHEHRLDLFDRDLRPVLKRNEAGGVMLLWDDYDAIVKPYLDGTAFADRIGVAAWPAPAFAGWPEAEFYGGAESENYRQTFSAVLAESARHFDHIGATSKMFLWPQAGGTGSQAYQRQAALARMGRSASPGTPILSELPAGPPPETLWSVPRDFDSLSDMYAPPAELVNPAVAGELARKRNSLPLAGLYLRPGVQPYLGNFNLLSDPADVRALPWLCMKYRCAGIFLPEVLNWDGAVASADGSEGRLFYPGAAFGAEGVLPSVRLKRLRRGLQDAAYIWLLRQRGSTDQARRAIGALVRYAGLDAAGDNYLDVRLDGWERDGGAWSAAAALLAGDVQAAVHPREDGTAERAARETAWAALRQRTVGLRVEGTGGRVEPGAAGRIRAVARVELYNEFPHTVTAQVKLTPPLPWRAAVGKRKIDLPPGARAAVELSAEADLPAGKGGVPVPSNGKIPLGVIVSSAAGPEQALTVGVPFVTAEAPRSEIKIDGDLSDWPPRMGDSAGDFVALGRRERLGAGLARRQTQVFVLRDRRNLYLAFRCREPEIGRLTAQASNIVRYEQLMACGDDLVEAVLDPGRSAKSPDQLYYIAVKANGVLLAQRGVRTDPPLGRWSPWPAAIQSAVGRKDDHWVVEMAIPLESFGSAGENEFWGANFARFAVADNESSNWAGAPRYIFSPAGLGTLRMEKPKAK